MTTRTMPFLAAPASAPTVGRGRSRYGSPGGRLLLTAAIIDGMSTGSLIQLPVFGYHAMPYRILLPACVLYVALRFLTHQLFSRGTTAQRIEVPGFLTFFAGACLFAAVSLAWVVDLTAGIRQVYFILEGVAIVVLAVVQFDSEDRLNRLARLWLIVLAIMSTIGIWEMTTRNHLPNAGVLKDQHRITYEEFGNMPSAVFGNPNNFAFFLVLTMPLAVSWWRHHLRGRGAVSFGLLFAAAIVSLIFTRSKLGYIGMLVVLASWMLVQRVGRRSRARGAGWKLLRLAPLLFVPFLFSATSQAVMSQLEDFQETLRKGLREDHRVNLAAEVADVLVRTNGVGVGAGNIETYVADYPFSRATGTFNPHGWWVEIAGNYGVMGFAAFSIFYLVLLRGLWRAYRFEARRGGERTLLEASVVGLIAYPVMSFSASSLMGVPFHWTFLAFSVAVLNTYRGRMRGC